MIVPARPLLPLLLAAALAACATPRAAVAPPPPVAPPTAEVAAPETAAAVGARAVRFADVAGWGEADQAPALAAFVRSCRALARRTDATGLTRAGDWDAPCAAAAATPPTGARGFFEAQFTPVVVGEGTGLNTGYFEPEIVGSRIPLPGVSTPIYRRPPDLIDVDLGQFADNLKGRTIRGRVADTKFVLYHDRAAIEDGALANRGLEIGYAADPIELFFLHIQGSGRVRLPDGSVMRIGYDAQNGREYVGIGGLLRRREILPPGGASMDGIIGWIRANPAEGAALMRENKSYIFFRELTGDGPLGALSVALTPETSVAADPKFVPLGAPLFLDTTIVEPGNRYVPFRRTMVAQDTGGAIKGANRLDLFWGAGDRAQAIAGGLSATGRTTLLLPRAAAARLTPLLAGDPTPRP